MRRIQTFEGFIFEFLKDTWIRKSKVVSKDGSPLTVYHGTNQNFNKFDMSYFGKTDDGFYGKGFYFTNEKQDAYDYGDIILSCNLRIEKPFYLRSYSTVGSAVELDLRDDLAKLNGMPKDLKTIRTLPKGYHVNRREYKDENNQEIIEYAVWPDESLYDTDDEEYGPDIKIYKKDEKSKDSRGELQAIVAFNDMINNVDYASGQANWLLQKVDRDNFHEILKKNGYDGIFVVGAKGDKTPIEEVSEFIVWNADQIQIMLKAKKI